MSCTTCDRHRAKESESRAYLGRLARKAARTGMPSDIRAMEKAKAAHGKQKQFNDERERQCEGDHQ